MEYRRVLTDGVNNEGRSTAADVAKVVKDMLAMEKHKIFFMGLQLDNEDFQKIGTEMGIPANCIDVVERDPRAIRSRFQLFSQSASAIASGGIKAAS